MHFDVAQRVNLAGQAIALLQFADRKFRLFFQREFGDFAGDDLDFTVTAGADAAANADDIHVKVAGAFEQGSFAFALAAASYGFKVDVEQRDFSFSTFSTKYILSLPIEFLASNC